MTGGSRKRQLADGGSISASVASVEDRREEFFAFLPVWENK
jgi:hypothetical protein